jgi:hypothetical protein
VSSKRNGTGGGVNVASPKNHSIPSATPAHRRKRMPDEPVLDTNDEALIGYFLRGIFRFEKFVRAQGTENVVERIEKAYGEALIIFKERQGGKK